MEDVDEILGALRIAAAEGDREAAVFLGMFGKWASNNDPPQHDKPDRKPPPSLSDGGKPLTRELAS